MKVKYTSSHLKSQIYIGAVNWVLLVAVLFMVFFFKRSENLAAAYGFAVTATMTISGIFMIWIFGIQRVYSKMAVAIVVFIADLLFLFAVFDKIPHGGFWSIIIALIPFFIINLWSNGNKKMHKSFRSLPIDTFIYSYEQIYDMGHNIKGTALFFTRSLTEIPPYMVHCIIRGNIIYERNILVSIITTDNPYGVSVSRSEINPKGLSGLEVHTGYMEILNLGEILKTEGINEKVIFYGVEDIITPNFIYKIFSLLKKITPPFVRFYKLPYNKLHGVVTRLDI
jgi:KUP system potassium uptake protein